MDEILRLRFRERDKAFEEELTAIKQNMAARGLLYSGNTVKSGHDALVAEYTGSRKAIVTAVAENLRITKPNKVDPDISEDALRRLEERKRFLEQFYMEKMKPIEATLQNKKSLEPYTNLNDVAELNEHELRAEITQVVTDFINSQGETFYHRVKNQFLNRPLVVIGVIAFSVVLAVLTFVSLLLDL